MAIKDHPIIYVAYMVKLDDMKSHQLQKQRRGGLECTVNVYYGTRCQCILQFNTSEYQGVGHSVTGSNPTQDELVPFGGLAAKIRKLN